MLKDIRNFIQDNIFKIIIRDSEGTLVVNGNELIITKLLDDEILINGKIKTVEFK